MRRFQSNKPAASSLYSTPRATPLRCSTRWVAAFVASCAGKSPVSPENAWWHAALWCPYRPPPAPLYLGRNRCEREIQETCLQECRDILPSSHLQPDGVPRIRSCPTV